MVRIGRMAKRNLLISRRSFLSGMGCAALAAALCRRGFAADAPKTLLLRAAASKIVLRPGQAETSVWSLEGPTPGVPLRCKQGDRLEIALQNDLPTPIALHFRGVDGVAAAEPLVVRPPVAAGANATFSLPLRHAGTLLCDVRLLADGAKQPTRPLALVVEETSTVSDRDEVFLVEDWRLRSDVTAAAPGADGADAPPLFTINGRLLPEFAVRSGERLRLRFINGCQRQVIAVKIEGHDVRVMALDGEPAEPFLARNGALVLAPGGRADVLIDATAPLGSISAILVHDGKEARAVARLATSTEPPLRPAPLPAAPALPSNGLPAELDLRNALRIDLLLTGNEWVRPSTFATSAAPAFRAKAGRVVVLALTNRATVAAVFHLHGHHFRLLDRLDDGWKPYWLDTLAIEPGQTQRMAFAAEHAGRWLIESTATDWSAPKLLRWYSVD
jgi:FtsP/CotA-like multicopper oxidase with cupredoxin domain